MSLKESYENSGLNTNWYEEHTSYLKSETLVELKAKDVQDEAVRRIGRQLSNEELYAIRECIEYELGEAMKTVFCNAFTEIFGKGFDVFLTVPYAEKDHAKALGAKWSKEHSLWYVPAGISTTPFKKWLKTGN